MSRTRSIGPRYHAGAIKVPTDVPSTMMSNTNSSSLLPCIHGARPATKLDAHAFGERRLVSVTLGELGCIQAPVRRGHAFSRRFEDRAGRREAEIAVGRLVGELHSHRQGGLVRELPPSQTRDRSLESAVHAKGSTKIASSKSTTGRKLSSLPPSSVSS